MSRKIFLLLLASLLFTSACGNVATPTNAVTLLPRDCRMQINQKMPMTLDGIIPPNAVVQWETNGGSISFAPPGLNAFFTAPSQPAIITVSVTISSGTPSVQIPITRECVVVDDSAPTQPQQPSTEPVQPQLPVPVIPGTLPTIIISEVMANPCGGIEVKKWNEYVELYNYGDQPVDVGGWWLADNGGNGSPDKIVSWSQRNPIKILSGQLITNTTVIPAKEFALILSPSYADGEHPHAMPYSVPNGTIILTAAESRSLGDDSSSLVGDGQGRDVLILYRGGASVIQETISTYGTPKPTEYVSEVSDNYLDNLPLDLHECASIERILPTGADGVDNWREIANGSPGEAPY